MAVKSRMIKVMRIWDYERLSNGGHEQISDYEITKRSEAYMAQFEETTCKSDIFLYTISINKTLSNNCQKENLSPNSINRQNN